MKKLTSLLLLSAALSTQAFATSDCFADLAAKRFSGRSYDASRPVTKEQLALICQAGHSSPSCFNEQPWRFIICDKNTDPNCYNKLFSTLVEFNQGWAKNAPVLVAIFASSDWARGGKNNWAEFDTGAATFGMMMQATSLGLMAHQMGGFDPDKIKELFSVPDRFNPISVMAIGYAAEDQEAPERNRKPLSENFFMGKWGS